MRSILCVTELCWCPLAVSLGRRIPAVQHGAGGHSLVAQQSVHPLRVLADLHHQLGAVHREERVRQLRSGDPGQILAEGERPSIYPWLKLSWKTGNYFSSGGRLVYLFRVVFTPALRLSAEREWGCHVWPWSCFGSDWWSVFVCWIEQKAWSEL